MDGQKKNIRSFRICFKEIKVNHYRTPWVCRVPETLGKRQKTLGKLFAECNTRRIALAINSAGKANFAECHLSGTRQSFCRVQFGSRRKETVITLDPPLTATSPSVKWQGTGQIFFCKIFLVFRIPFRRVLHSANDKHMPSVSLSDTRQTFFKQYLVFLKILFAECCCHTQF